MNTHGLFKTTIVIWSEDELDGGLEDMAFEANEGAAYCSRASSTFVPDPASDPDWDGTEFFAPVVDDQEEDS